MQNIDAGIRSQAFFRDGADGKICAGPVWDYDLALGNRYAWPKPSANMAFASIEGIWGSEWYAKLYLKEVFYSRLTSVYETEFRPLLDYIVGEQIDRYAEEISAAAAMNRLRWGTGDAALEAKWMKRYLSERIEFLDSLWLKNEHYCKVTVFLEDGVRLRYYVCPGEVMPELRDYISTPFVTYDGMYNKKTRTVCLIPAHMGGHGHLSEVYPEPASRGGGIRHGGSFHPPLRTAGGIYGAGGADRRGGHLPQPKGGQTWENQNRSTFVMS